MTRRAALQSARFASSRHAIHSCLIAMFVAITPSLARGQASSVRQETASPSSTPVHQGSGDNPSPSIQLAPLDHVPPSPCRLAVPDATPELPAKGEPAPPASSTRAFSPLSARCKFNLFLRTTYSPYTFLGAGFQATLDQAQGQWPHYGGGTQGWGKRFGATLAAQQLRRF